MNDLAGMSRSWKKNDWKLKIRKSGYEACG